MTLAFYKVDNSLGYERHTFDDIYDKPERIKEKLFMLNDDELRCYDMSTPETADELVEDYNDEIIDGSGWWCIVIND
jgi:hypothetical protein